MLKAIRHALANLANFSGRDGRQAFWYYALFLVILNLVLGFAATVPMMVSAFQVAFEGVQTGMPEDEVAAILAARMSGQAETTLWVSLVMSLATTALLAASFVRRLHDSDHSGWWAGLAVLAQIGAAAFSITRIEELKAAIAASISPESMAAYVESQSQTMAYALIGWIAPLIVIIFGVMKSTPGPNRFGDAPFNA